MYDDYIYPMLIKWTVVELLPFINFKVMNKSVGQQNSDNTTPIDLETLKYLINKERGKAEFLTKRIKDHIISNVGLFPEYMRVAKLEDMVADKTSYFCGIEFDNKNRKLPSGYEYGNTDLFNQI